MAFISSIAVYYRHQLWDLFLYEEYEITGLFLPAAAIMAFYKDHGGTVSLKEENEFYEIQKISDFTLAADLDHGYVYRSPRQLNDHEIEKIHDPDWPYTLEELTDYFSLFTGGNQEYAKGRASRLIHRLQPVGDHKLYSHLDDILRWYRIPFGRINAGVLHSMMMNDSDLFNAIPERLRKEAVRRYQA